MKTNRPSVRRLLPLPPLLSSQIPISQSHGQQSNSEIGLNRRNILHSCFEGCWRLVMKDKCHDCNTGASTLVVTALLAQELTGSNHFGLSARWKAKEIHFAKKKSSSLTPSCYLSVSEPLKKLPCKLKFGIIPRVQFVSNTDKCTLAQTEKRQIILYENSLNFISLSLSLSEEQMMNENVQNNCNVADSKQVKSQYLITVAGFGSSLGLSRLHFYDHQRNSGTKKKNIDRNASSPISVFDCFLLGFG